MVAVAVSAAAAQGDAGEMKAFTHDFDAMRIERAIAAAERKTSGEIRVVVHRGMVDDAVSAAAAEFHRLQMHRTRNRNAVLLYIAPDARRFAIYGDRGVHEKCGDVFWRSVALALEADFRHGAFTAGLEKAIAAASDLLATHFPWQPGDINELPDDFVDRGVVI